jgi:hypothetical protein
MDPRSKIPTVGAGLRPARCHRAASSPPTAKRSPSPNLCGSRLQSNPRATARETSHIPVASLPFRNAGLALSVEGFTLAAKGVSPALLTFSQGGSPLLQQGELDFSPAKKRCLLRRGFSPGIFRTRIL